MFGGEQGINLSNKTHIFDFTSAKLQEKTQNVT